MDWLPIVSVVSLTVGGFSIAVAVASIWLSVVTHGNTKDVLARIAQSAAVVEEMVKGSQAKLIDTVADIASPPRVTWEDQLRLVVASNPALTEKLLEWSLQSKAAQGDAPEASPQ